MVLKADDLPELTSFDENERKKIVQRAMKKSYVRFMLPGFASGITILLGNLLDIASLRGFITWIALSLLLGGIIQLILINIRLRRFVQNEVEGL